MRSPDPSPVALSNGEEGTIVSKEVDEETASNDEGSPVYEMLGEGNDRCGLYQMWKALPEVFCPS